MQQVRQRPGETDGVFDVGFAVASPVAVQVARRDQDRFAGVEGALPLARLPELPAAVIEVGEGVEFKLPLPALPESAGR